MLRAKIERVLPGATSKVWHGSPVWFEGETPILGYNTSARGAVALLFWNGKAFGEPDHRPIGKGKAAQLRYGAVEDVKKIPLRRWLEVARTELRDIDEVRKEPGDCDEASVIQY